MEKNRQIIINTIYTIGGALLMNMVLQLIVYPLLNRQMGSEALGNLLYIMGLVAIICPSVGQALNTSRLVVRRDYSVTNGDYNILILLFGGIGTVVALVLSHSTGSAKIGIESLLIIFLFLTTAFRYYGDVEYRLNLNYKKYFINYIILSLGYLLGYGLFLAVDNWFLIFLVGEILYITYIVCTGTIFKDFLKAGKYFQIALSKGSVLVFSYFITNLTLNIDRVALKYLVGDLAVTQYYAASLIGKTLVILVAPVNIIIISYLTRSKERINRKQYFTFVSAGVVICIVFFFCAQIATPIFIKIFWQNLYDSIKGITMLVNITQILSMLSAYLFIVVLTFTEEKWQLILQICHLIIVVILVLIFTINHGIMGFVAATLIANLLRVIAIIILGVMRVDKKGRI